MKRIVTTGMAMLIATVIAAVMVFVVCVDRIVDWIFRRMGGNKK